MAIAKRKKSSTTRKAKAKPKSRKRVAATSSAGTMKIGGLNFSKAGCSKTKKDAQNLASRARNAGKNARVIQSGTGYCVYTRSRRAA